MGLREDKKSKLIDFGEFCELNRRGHYGESVRCESVRDVLSPVGLQLGDGRMTKNRRELYDIQRIDIKNSWGVLLVVNGFATL